MIVLAKSEASTENHVVICLVSLFRSEVPEYNLDFFKLCEIIV